MAHDNDSFGDALDLVAAHLEAQGMNVTSDEGMARVNEIAEDMVGDIGDEPTAKSWLHAMYPEPEEGTPSFW